MMPDSHHPPALPDAGARQRALLDYGATLLVEAGAGSGKTALMAGRVALMLAHGIRPREIVAVTFTEAAAAELLERIERFVASLAAGTVPRELELCSAETGLSADQRAAITAARAALEEITCTTIHGFCQQLIKPYPIEAGIDPGATIIDPAAADLAYQDLMTAWLSARFGRARGDDGLGRIPPMTGLGGEDDFFAELLAIAPDRGLSRLLPPPPIFSGSNGPRALPPPSWTRAFSAIFRRKYATSPTGMPAVALPNRRPPSALPISPGSETMLDAALSAPITGRVIARLCCMCRPHCCHSSEPRFKAWQNKGKWQAAACAAGFAKARGEQLCATAKAIYDRCSDAYQSFTANVAAAALARFVGEFDSLRALYADYKRQAALLDFDDLLHHARDLLVRDPGVRQALARRYPRILVDEFQDTDPLQAEILWLLCGEGAEGEPWTAPQAAPRQLVPGRGSQAGDLSLSRRRR